jgi:tetratricopeptide (TPR) repeat protein
MTVTPLITDLDKTPAFLGGSRPANQTQGSRDWVRVFLKTLIVATAFAGLQGCNKPSSAELYNEGTAKYNAGDYQGAVDAYTRSLAVDSTGGNAAFVFGARGDARLRLDDRDGAIVDFTHAIGLFPRDSSFFRGRGDAEFAKGAAKEAISDYDSALAVDPNDLHASFRRGNAKLGLGDADGAIADYTDVIQHGGLGTNDDAGHTFYNRGLAYYKKRAFNLAVSDFSAAIRYGDGIAYADCATARFQIDDWAGAIADSTHAIADDKKNADMFWIRSCAKRQVGDLAGSDADYDTAINLDAKYAKYPR